ncbi:short-chain dehydrogenase [Zopfia rhizophila CBS 207.26]|uniref:Short-chain dehydrogenase n=1 Tax=Zopfia rhizophila CBS 207.26 TaxID=1314779 RepID=A0A6A6DCL5_9PEZI|nr:short-chain dehydrogenase [Zopfia rhizophila CBS 207.26]
MSRYAKSHKRSSLAGPGDARPTALQIIKDEDLIEKLQGTVFLITGVSSGIGIETMRAIHATGAHVFGTVRDVEKGQAVVDKILASNPNGAKIDLIKMELDSFESIKAGAADFLKKCSGKLNVLINNAGVMATPKGRTKDGWETQFGTNHLGHFLLFQLVKDALLSSASPDVPSRVVSVSSTGHRQGPVRLHDFNFEKVPYNSWAAYGQAKTANIWFANAIERKYGYRNLHATSLHPGGISTGLQIHLDPELLKAFDTPEYRAYFKSPEQGAATQVYAAVSAEWSHKGGKFLSDCVEQAEVGTQGLLELNDDGYKSWAYDPDGEERLWKESFRMVGLAESE